MHSLEICALLDVAGLLSFFFPAAPVPTSLAAPAPVGVCQDLAGFIDALWWGCTITAEMAAPARVVPGRKVHSWTKAAFRRSDDGG